MKSNFDRFLKNVPDTIHANTKSYFSKYIAIFEPEKFIKDQVIYNEEYNFVLFYSTPPPAKIDNNIHQFKKGSLVVIKPKRELTIFSPKRPIQEKYLSITINQEFIQQIIYEITGSENFRFQRPDNFYSKQLLELLENFKTEIINFGISYPMLLQSMATQIGFQLVRDVITDSVITKKKNYKDNHYVNEAIEYMQNYYSSNITIEEICRIIYISPHHFERVFREKTGQTPYRFLTNIRMQKAKEFLKKDSLSIEEVARFCGFVNGGHFSTVFKRIVGLTPSAYRKTLY